MKIIAKSLATLSAVSLLAFTPLLAMASGGHAPTAKATPASTMKRVIEGNNSFIHHHATTHFDAFQSGQVPNLTIITCSDSRVQTQLFGFEPDNNIFAIRNIGNQIVNSEGSVDYGVHHLPTKVLLILGHSSCGAVKAAMGDYSGESSGIKAELEPLQPMLEADPKTGSFDGRWADNVERNVDYQVAKALELYGDKVEAGELAVVGAVYDFNNLWGKGRGAVVVVNVNGENKPGKIQDHPVLGQLNRGDIVTHVGSRVN
ncbi:MAG: carbonic anhydrase [Thermodesulfobacteriota bacterium]